MEIQINKKNIKKRLNADIDIGGVCGGDVGTILVTEFVLYFSLSKQYPDKHKFATNKHRAQMHAGHVSPASSHTSSLHAAVEFCAKINSVKRRRGGQHLAVHNYI